jgi:recombinational DNA repair ATPase RecF
VGTHKDDLSFEIDGHPIKKFGSQGQQKSFLIALKLAQFEFLKKQSGVKPILLFDDIFDKLDESRVANNRNGQQRYFWTTVHLRHASGTNRGDCKIDASILQYLTYSICIL